MRLTHLSIKGKLNTIIMTTSLIVLVLSSALYIITDLVKLRRAIVERLFAVSRVVGNNCSAALVFNDAAAAEETLSGLSAETHIISARISRKNGQEMARFSNATYTHEARIRNYHVDPVSYLATLRDGTDNYGTHSLHGSYLELSQPIVYQGEILGLLQLHYSMKEYESRLLQYGLISVSVLLLSALAAYFISSKLQKVISDPILGLAGHMQTISRDKDYTRLKQKESNDEIGTLIDGFNEMMKQIKLSQDMIVERDRRLKHMLISAPVVIYSARPTLAFSTTYISENVDRLFGYLPQQFLDEPKFWLSCIHPEDRTGVLRMLDDIGDRESYFHEYRFRKSSGDYYWVHDEFIILRDEEGNARESIGCLIDINQRKELEQQLIHNALHDKLTGLPNRALFQDRLNRAFDQHLQSKSRSNAFLFAVFYMDLDRFKNINDSMGHLAGDELLVSVAARLKKVSRIVDTVARLGGDEFALILGKTGNEASVVGIADRILGRLKEPFTIRGQKVYITASIGITMSSRNYANPDDMLRDADTALYKAKKLGKARHVFFDDSMHDSAVSVMKIETDLRDALTRNELDLHYQPIVLAGSNRLVGFEALMRWKHPREGMIPPSLFIPVAEESGIIEEMGRWAIFKACQDLVRLQAEFINDQLLTVSVNVSSRQFKENLIEDIERALKRSGLDPRCLKLEVTESIIMEHLDTAVLLLLRLKEMGVEIYVDDFGTGYSSLSYLQKLPLNALKIDRSFISMMTNDQGSHEIVKGILGLANNLNLHVIAEGVEDLGQSSYLQKMGCKYIQGYAISPALGYEPLIQFLKSRIASQPSA